MKKKLHHIQDGEKTEKQWNLLGYKVKQRQKGIERYVGYYYGRYVSGIYFTKEQVKVDPDIAQKVKDAEKERKRKYQRERRARLRRERKELEAEQRREERHRRRRVKIAAAAWKKIFKAQNRIVVFDTETTGLSAENNYILSLSWQVLDGKLRKLDEQTRYFTNPLPEERCKSAVRVNGLTNQRLKELGTTGKRKAIRDILSAFNGCSLVVAHNYSFDRSFLLIEAKRNGIKMMGKFPPFFDTMEETTDFCKIEYWDWDEEDYEYKYPRLQELAECLNVDTSDINWHRSSSDVEVTVRCLRKIVGDKLVENGKIIPSTIGKEE